MARDDGNRESLGRFIRDRRQELGFTQTQLAERLGWAQERISVLENGKYGMPSLSGLARLADGLDSPLPALLEVTGYGGSFAAAGAPDGATAQGNGALYYTLQRLMEVDATTVKGALNSASDLLAEAMRTDKIDAFIMNPANQILVALGTSNTPMGRRQHEIGLHVLPIANRGREVEVYETGKVFCTGDARNDPHISVGAKETLGVRSMLAVPLWVEGTIRGVLVAESAQRDLFTEDDEHFLTTVARWVGLIAGRAELNEAMRQTVAQESRRVVADELITALAHDLGNYLTPLKGRIDILHRRLSRDGRERDLEDTQAAARAVSSIQKMVSRLLDVSRLDQGLFSLSLQPVDLANLVEEVAAAMRASWDALEVRAPDELEVEADPIRVREVVVNLITNAMHHSPDGAPIILSAGAEHRTDGEWAVVSVRDEGPGIAPDLLPHLFERFSAGVCSSGLGLGLYLSHRLIEAHGGTLTVESSVGHGATFCLALPCRRTP